MRVRFACLRHLYLFYILLEGQFEGVMPDPIQTGTVAAS